MENQVLSNPNLKDLAFALSKAQAEIKPPVKNRHVDFQPKNGGQRVKYSYADLADVIDCIKVPLSKNELCLFHKLEYQNQVFGLKTVLMHSSGQAVDTWYPLPDPSKNQIKAQEFGSALTYGRRYSVSLLIGIASEEDDDGAAAASVTDGKNQNQNQHKNKNQQQPRPSGNTPPVQPIQKQNPSTPGDYVFQFGKFKGMKVKEIPYDDLSNWHSFINSQQNKGGAQEAFEFVSAFINHFGDFQDEQTRNFANAPDPEWNQNV